MKKFIATSLIFILSITVLMSGASGFSDCAIECQRAMQKAHSHAAMTSASLRAPDCCAGHMNKTCEMNRVPQVKIPECSIMCNPTVSSNLIAVGAISGDAATDQDQTTQVDQRLIAGQLIKTSPIYLRTLALLC